MHHSSCWLDISGFYYVSDLTPPYRTPDKGSRRFFQPLQPHSYDIFHPFLLANIFIIHSHCSFDTAALQNLMMLNASVSYQFQVPLTGEEGIGQEINIRKPISVRNISACNVDTSGWHQGRQISHRFRNNHRDSSAGGTLRNKRGCMVEDTRTESVSASLLRDLPHSQYRSSKSKTANRAQQSLQTQTKTPIERTRLIRCHSSSCWEVQDALCSSICRNTTLRYF
jgi:hypothetical protein